jgi:hypothetical protein
MELIKTFVYPLAFFGFIAILCLITFEVDKRCYLTVPYYLLIMVVFAIGLVLFMQLP